MNLVLLFLCRVPIVGVVTVVTPWGFGSRSQGLKSWVTIGVNPGDARVSTLPWACVT